MKEFFDKVTLTNQDENNFLLFPVIKRHGDLAKIKDCHFQPSMPKTIFFNCKQTFASHCDFGIFITRVSMNTSHVHQLKKYKKGDFCLLRNNKKRIFL